MSEVIISQKKYCPALVLALILSLTILAAEAALAGGVLRLDEVPVGELDPGKASDYADSILMFNIYDTLILPKQGDSGHAPHLARSWEAGDNSFTFSLRNDVRFHSGNRLTAKDVVFSLERTQALGQGLSYLFSVVESAEALDDHTVRFNLTETYAPFVASLVRLPIVDSQLVKANFADGDGGEMGDWGEAFLSANAAGSGAYRVVSHNPQEETVLEKSSDHFLATPQAAPDRVRLRYGLEASTVRTLVAQGEHDIASQWLPPEVVSALVKDGAQIFTEGGTGGLYMKMNTTKPPLDDVNCRLALAAAFDYESARKLIAITNEVSAGSAATGAIPVGMLGADPSAPALRRDLDAARAYLSQCRYTPSEHTLEISWIAEVPLEERFALLMQANFSELGFGGKIRKLPWALFAEQVSNAENTPHISQLFVNAVTGDPDTLLYGMYHSSVAGTWQSPEHLNDAEVDRLLEKGRRSTDENVRAIAYAALNARLLEIAPTIYAYDNLSIFAASPRVKAPPLQEASSAFGLDQLGFSFRLMEVSE